jgi:hypothetical protein
MRAHQAVGRELQARLIFVVDPGFGDLEPGAKLEPPLVLDSGLNPLACVHVHQV